MPGTADLAKLTQRITAFRDARDWKQFHTPKDVAISLSLEASELLEVFQWQQNGPDEKQRERISDELADILYWTLLMAHDLELDLAEAFEQKMKKNEAKYPVSRAKGSSKKYTEL